MEERVYLETENGVYYVHGAQFYLYWTMRMKLGSIPLSNQISA